MDEKIFLNERGVIVTNARFVVPSQTFAMSGITSISMLKESPKRFAPVLLAAFGGVIIAASDQPAGKVVGTIICFAGLLLLIGQKTQYHVLLRTSAGDTKALSSFNQRWIEAVVNAMNKSIIYRG